MNTKEILLKQFDRCYNENGWFVAVRNALDGVTVDYYGTPTPLSQVANLAVPASSLITAQPWDKSMIPAIEKALEVYEAHGRPRSEQLRLGT